ncbi:MAG: YoeB-YefM toxin-antitoxin system antitoxin YefM [Desulfobacteraceae bacterium]|nr:YoeB-YefM toxin-antitoxin system antitoxin YefM [Desulfobacteraceae bacterium]
MRAISYTTARNNLAGTMKQVCDDHDPVIVTRKNNEAVILMSLEDYESLKETAYLMQSPGNAKRLIASLEELRAGNGKERELLE